MHNRILDAYVATHHADPAGAELRVVVRPEAITPGTEIKGRLMGPRSAYAGTVEIAFPYRELARTDHILLRVLIPEPSFWEPKTPLLYEGPLELWQDGERCDQVVLRHGIRAVQMTERGLRVGSQLCRLQGVTAANFTEADARRWHAVGINLVVTTAGADSSEMLRLADRFGLFVLGRIEESHEWPRWPQAHQRHPSFLGCVLSAGIGAGVERTAVPGLIGAELAADGDAPNGRFDFVLADAGQTMKVNVPMLLNLAATDAVPAAAPNMLGWVRQS